MTTFTNNTIPEENTHYTCIYAIDIDSVLKINKKSFPKAYLEQCKYKLKKNAQDILIILKLLIMIVKMVVIAIVLIMLKLKKKLKIL